MTLRCVGAIVVCTLLVSACATEPDPFYQERRAALDPRNVAACKARGGRTEPVCLAGVPACVIHHRDAGRSCTDSSQCRGKCVIDLSLIHISEPTRLLSISYAVFCLKKKKK